MDESMLVDLAARYIHSVLAIESVRDGGFFAVYGMEQHRRDAHEALCEALGVDQEATKEICLFMDKSIGLPLHEMLEDDELEKYGKLLIDKLRAIS